MRWNKKSTSLVLIIIAFAMVIFVITPKANSSKPTFNYSNLHKAQLPSEPEIETSIRQQKEIVASMRESIPRDEVFDGLRIVIDIGHGEGNDPGALRSFKFADGKEIIHAESNLTLDIARRLGWYFRYRGASGIFYTLGPNNMVDPDTEDNYSYYHPYVPPPMMKQLNTLLMPSRNAWTDLQAALSTRTEVANQKLKTYGGRVIFISIHVDSTAAHSQGMRVYRFYGQRSLLSNYIAKSATTAGLARKLTVGKITKTSFPEMQAAFVVIDPRFNKVGEKLLIETANIRNDQDFFEILLPAQGREKLAYTIGNGVADYCLATRTNNKTL